MTALITTILVVLVAAASKWRGGLEPYGGQLSELIGVSRTVGSLLARALVVVELAWAASLALFPRGSAAFTVVALSALSVVSSLALRRGARECLCYGTSVRSSPRTAVLRNTILTILSAAVVFTGPAVYISVIVDVGIGVLFAFALVRLEDLTTAMRTIVRPSTSGAS